MEAKARPRRRINWWMVAFFVLLIAFELTRELLVVASSKGASPNGSASFITGDGYTTVEGRWRRTDGGGDLLPSVIRIECRQAIGQCVEASNVVFGDSVFPPDLEWFDADFTDEAITYRNSNPACASYIVRLDLKLRQVFSVREKKADVPDSRCGVLEPRIEMTVADASLPSDYTIGDHLVPLVRVLVALF